jgi:hypothetical protein
MCDFLHTSPTMINPIAEHLRVIGAEAARALAAEMSAIRVQPERRSSPRVGTGGADEVSQGDRRSASRTSKAGQRSLARSALVEAAEQLARALDQIATLQSMPALRREQISLQVALITPREQELKLLMDKAEQGTGGAFANMIAYESDYVTAQEAERPTAWLGMQDSNSETSSQKISFCSAFGPHRSFHAQTPSN